jgi:N-acetylglucosaminyl-diphospho-decaprenol L-rhamnosyltransferase
VKPAIDVVIPVHNRWELTESCLRHLQAQTVLNTVIVCDNDSTDGTPERLRNEFPEVRLVQLDRNLGFPAACNRGVEAGAGEIVVLLNNDVDCRPDFLERIVAPFHGDEILGSVAALLLKPGEEVIDSFGLTADVTLAGYPRLRDFPVEAAQTVDPVLIGPLGGAGAYRRAAWEEVGGLDEGVFIYGEDVELSLRLRAAGWSTAGAADAIAVHIGSATMATRSSRQRYEGGFARGYFLRRYGVLRSRVGPRAALTEAAVVIGDALLFSHDLVALRGRIAGWRAAGRSSRRPRPPAGSIDRSITFLDSLRLRVGVYTGRAPRPRRHLRSGITSS